VVLGVDASNHGTDAGQLAPMVEQIERRTGVRPKNMLADGGYSGKEELQALNQPESGYRVYAPVREADKQWAKGQDPYAPRPEESAEITEWRTRMGTAAAKEIYQERAATAECVNALARNRGMTQLPVRGPTKARTIALWFAVAHNLRRWAVYRTEVCIQFTTFY
jgi:IS5 family transposase